MSLNVALFSEPPLPEWCQVIVDEARRRGHKLLVVGGFMPGLDFDVSFMRVHPHHHSDHPPDYWVAAQTYEMSGLPLLNSIASRELAGNKLDLFERFRRSGLNTPDSFSLEDPNLPDFPLVCKPRSGSRGQDVIIAHSLEDAMAHQQEVGRPCLLQQIIDTGRCLRVVATPDGVISAYEKHAVPGQFVLSVALGADRRPINTTPEIREMATRMVSAIDADLCGCDILEDTSGNLWALEINTSFAFDPGSQDIVDGFVDRLEELSASRAS